MSNKVTYEYIRYIIAQLGATTINKYYTNPGYDRVESYLLDNRISDKDFYSTLYQYGLVCKSPRWYDSDKFDIKLFNPQFNHSKQYILLGVKK